MPGRVGTDDNGVNGADTFGEIIGFVHHGKGGLLMRYGNVDALEAVFLQSPNKISRLLRLNGERLITAVNAVLLKPVAV